MLKGIVDGENLQNSQTCWLVWTTSMDVYNVDREESGKGTRSSRNLCAKMIMTFKVPFPEGLPLGLFRYFFLT